jgi:hypothetical protein
MPVVVIYCGVVWDVAVQDCNEEYCKGYQVLVKILTEDVENSQKIKLSLVPMVWWGKKITWNG